MSDFQPIPGVTYRVTHFGRQRLATFTPQAPEDFAPWVDLDGDWFQLEGDDKILGVAYNPHPPTRTEWALSWYGADDADQSKEPFGENEAKARERHAAFLKNPARPYTRRLMRRQVTETEWQEVDQ